VKVGAKVGVEARGDSSGGKLNPIYDQYNKKEGPAIRLVERKTNLEIGKRYTRAASHESTYEP
jgi:hypothetical protein